MFLRTARAPNTECHVTLLSPQEALVVFFHREEFSEVLPEMVEQACQPQFTPRDQSILNG